MQPSTYVCKFIVDLSLLVISIIKKSVLFIIESLSSKNFTELIVEQQQTVHSPKKLCKAGY